MFTVKERNEILERIIKFLKTLDVKLIALVGSCGNGSADQYSDLDMSVVVDKNKLQEIFNKYEKFINTMDIFKYFKTTYNEESLLIGAFLNSGLELDVGFTTLNEFEKNRIKRTQNKISVVYGDKSYENVEIINTNANYDSLNYIIETAWYNIKNAMVALKREKLFRTVKEIDDFRLIVVETYGKAKNIETKHFRQVDNLDNDFKQLLANSYFKEFSYNGLKISLLNTLDLFYWVLEKLNASDESQNYKNMFAKLLREIKL